MVSSECCLCEFCRTDPKANTLPKHYLDSVVKNIHDAKNYASTLNVDDYTCYSNHTIDAIFRMKAEMFRYCMAHLGENEVEALKSKFIETFASQG